MTHVVAIFKDTREPNPYVVAPARLVMEQGDEVFVYNTITGKVGTVNVEFDGEKPFGENLTPTADIVTPVQKLQEPKPGVYPYEVKVHGQLAQGSRPIIIVYK